MSNLLKKKKTSNLRRKKTVIIKKNQNRSYVVLNPLIRPVFIKLGLAKLPNQKIETIVSK